MKVMTNGMRLLVAAVISFASGAADSRAEGPTTSIKAEYLMTLTATLETPRFFNTNLRVVNVTGGAVEGPQIKGKLVPPMADWPRTMPSGVNHLDVRGAVQTDDGELIFMAYTGVQQCPKDKLDRLAAGEAIKADDCYFITAITFETKSEKYGWPNAVQAVGKATTLIRGETSRVVYDLFVIR